MADRLREQRNHMFVIATVDEHVAFPSMLDQLDMAQKSELMGNRGLRHAELLGDMAHGARFLRKQMEDPDAGGIGERLENFRYIFNCRRG